MAHAVVREKVNLLLQDLLEYQRELATHAAGTSAKCPSFLFFFGKVKMSELFIFRRNDGNKLEKELQSGQCHINIIHKNL